ncbi:type II toxin-antitoxin system VapC family toxin [Pandoraea sp. NPDC090278]|uniref:type II toxin-antitoxin system VapC family toxin n=1 Tax=Pandoraea sp. NPDC090278 TaxID=3364391 RepID=UPI00383A3896
MIYLLDTNIVIAMLKGVPEVLFRLRAHSPNAFALPSIVTHELYFGAYRGAQVEANLARVQGLQLQVIPFDAEDAEHAGEIRAVMARAGSPVGAYDALIAGQARARQLVLITQNARVFARVPGLTVEDWKSGLPESVRATV